MAVHFRRRQILDAGNAASLEENKGLCPGSPTQVRAIVADMQGRLDKWKLDNPENQHDLIIQEDELRWRCKRCDNIGGTFFHFDYHFNGVLPPQGGERAARMQAKALDWRFEALVETACVLHQLPEKVT